MSSLPRVLIEGSPSLGVSVPAQTAIADAAAVVLAANPKRKGLMLQNTGTTILRFTFGPTNPTQTAYHVGLKACAVADDGTGGVYVDDCWAGVVRCISSAAGGTFVATEFLTGNPDWNQAMDAGTYPWA